MLGIEPNYDTEYSIGFTVGGDELGLHPLDGRQRPPRGGQTAYYWTHRSLKGPTNASLPLPRRGTRPFADNFTVAAQRRKTLTLRFVGLIGGTRYRD